MRVLAVVLGVCAAANVLTGLALWATSEELYRRGDGLAAACYERLDAVSTHPDAGVAGLPWEPSDPETLRLLRGEELRLIRWVVLSDFCATFGRRRE